ncbi:MAG: hypothetical protein HY736_06225 [Verrucomicrobia bacterium]|nr:hypothetical protein [Verrucomicrobiota bacterium]
MNTFPIPSHLRSSFRKIGADVRVIALQAPRRTWRATAVSRERIRVLDRLFELILPPQASAVVLDCRKDVRRHARHAPNGITEEAFRLQTEAIRKSLGWSRRMRFQEAGSILARGAVRHPDHATIHLRSWHRVFINSEQRPASLGFLDWNSHLTVQSCTERQSAYLAATKLATLFTNKFRQQPSLTIFP